MLTRQLTGLQTDSTALSRRAAERHAVLTAIKDSRSSGSPTPAGDRATEALLRLLAIDGWLRRRSLW